MIILIKRVLYRFFIFMKELFGLTSHVYILTHNDTDGVCSGAIVLRYFKKGEIFIGRAGMVHETIKLFRAKNRILVITDLSINKQYLKETTSHLTRLKKNGWKIIWLDHHIWDHDLIEGISKVVDKLRIDTRFVGGELAYQEFGDNDVVSKKLAEIARDADMVIRDLELTRLYVNALRGCHYGIVKHMIKTLAKGVFRDSKIEMCAEKGVEKTKKSKEYAKNTQIIITNSGRRFGLIDLRGKRLSGGEVANTAIELYNLDFSVVIYRNNRLSFYAKSDSNINLLTVAKKLGGGGHPTACGAALKLSLKSKILSKILGRFYYPKELKEAIRLTKELM